MSDISMSKIISSTQQGTDVFSCQSRAGVWAGRTLRVARGVVLAAAIGAASWIGACTAHQGPYAPLTEGARSPLKAEGLTQEAAALIGKDDAKAESLLREALTEDLYHGPAHNNLGVIFLKQGKLYEAAGEFEWARKLMPGHADPRMNLALTLETAGHVDDAIGTYRTALEVAPDHIQTIQALARLQCKSGKKDARTLEALQTIAMRGDSERWRDWARQMLVRADRPDSALGPDALESRSR